jgi:hypothetical protein
MTYHLMKTLEHVVDLHKYQLPFKLFQSSFKVKFNFINLVISKASQTEFV